MKLIKVIFLLAISFFVVSCDSDKKSVTEVNAEIDDLDKRHKAELEKEYAENGFISTETEARQQKEKLEYLEANSSKLSGDQAKVLRASAKTMKKLEAMRLVLSQPDPAFDDAYDYSNISSVEDIDKKIAILEKHLQANTDYKKFVKTGFYELFEKNLEEEGLSAGTVSRVVRDTKLKDRKSLELVTKFQNEEENVFRGVVNQLTLLKENYGNWTWDSETEAPIFEEAVSDAVIDKFNALYTQISEAADRQGAVQEQLIKLK